jgi:oligopeptide/dipeptide ABC transporter ATP-binding protein
MQDTLISVSNLTKWFSSRERGGMPVQAVTDVSFDLKRGEVLGLVGESGSGKSTIGQTIIRLHKPDSGRIDIDGVDFAGASERALRRHRKLVQMVFQDPSSSLNPRIRIGDVLHEALAIHGIGATRQVRRDRVAELLDMIGFSPDFAQRYPHQLSGGQRQRVGIARALAVEPKALIADEAVSALDVSIQAQIIQLLADLRRKLSFTLIFISHDMNVVEYISDRVAVLYLGRIVEMGPARDIFKRPRHPYTEALLSAIPDPSSRKRERIILQGEIPNPSNPPSGCVFRTRCRHAVERCATAVPPLAQVLPAHLSACIRQEVYLNDMGQRS